jgi:hypothetical protein
MIEHRLLGPGDFRRMPWKNGRGRTTEIAAHPPRSALDGFDWRVSVAEIARDGPFSHFEGVDRIIVLIGGSSMRLEGPAHEVELRADYTPYAFRGEDPIECKLLDGPVRDFNVMLRRGRSRGEVIAVQHESVRVAPARFRLCYSVAGACECLVGGHPPMAVAADHALLIEDDPAAATATALTVNPLAADGVALVASIDLVP